MPISDLRYSQWQNFGLWACGSLQTFWKKLLASIFKAEGTVVFLVMTLFSLVVGTNVLGNLLPPSQDWSDFYPEGGNDWFV
jgi:hypothetical protein